MKKNIFEMGANFESDWSSDNKKIDKVTQTVEILPPEKHQLHFAKEKRRGKVVTIVKPFHIEKKELQLLLKKLKKRFGTGGTVTETSLELQGDSVTLVKPYLQELGYRMK